MNTRSTFTIKTEKKEDIQDITQDVQSVLNRHSVYDGLMLLFPLHTSCTIFINDSDPNLLEDVKSLLQELVPDNRTYQHNTSDPKENAPAHLKSILTGHHVTVPITEGTLDFGQYQKIYYAEFDGQRPKEILIKILS